MHPNFQPMQLLKRAAPFDDDGWLFELKYDGFRALTVIEHGRTQLLSRNGHPFASFSALAESISDSLPNVRAVIDGEICSLDRRGRPQFKNLMFRRGNPPLIALGERFRNTNLLPQVSQGGVREAAVTVMRKVPQADQAISRPLSLCGIP
jgi:ATP dependent DNA ligase-like protein